MRPLVVLALATLLVGCSSIEKPPRNINSICAIFNEKPHWKREAQRASGKWNVHVPTMMSIMYQESSFRADARPMKKNLFGWESPASTAYGYSQALDGTWMTYMKSTKQWGAQRDDFGDAVDFMGWYMDVSRKRNGLKLTDARNHYLAYHEGWGGYANKTFRQKPWLVNVAKKVETRAKKFTAEYPRCR